MALATVAGVLCLAPAASAASYSPQPVGPAWVPPGGAHAVLPDESRGLVYVGGTFGVVALTADTGVLVWNADANGDVRALALAPDGRLLVGGAFTTVGGDTHRKIAAVDASTGVVDRAFRAAVGGTVRDLVVVGTTAYFGGQFTNHGGMAQQGLGAVDATTGELDRDFAIAANGNVYALGTDGIRLFIGGTFTAVGGRPRNQLASVTLSSGTLDDWAPARACSTCSVVWDLTLDVARNRVYTVGRNPGTLWTVDMTTAGRSFTRGVGSVNGDSQAVTLAPDGTVYVGGHFVTINGQKRMLVAEFDVSGSVPVLGDFFARFVTSYPGVWALAGTSSRLYVAGDFTAAGEKVNGRNRYPSVAFFPASGAAGGRDTTPPTVTTTPAAGATEVSTSTDVTAAFSEAVQNVEGNFTLTDAGGGAVPATVTYDSATAVATLHPAAALAAGTQYTARLTGSITDAAVNPLAATTWSFTTAADSGGGGGSTGPTVTGTNRADGDTAVPLSTNIVVYFGEEVQGVGPATFTLTPAGGSAVSGVYSSNGAGTRWAFNPDVNLARDTWYTLSLTSGITNPSGAALAPVSWTFLTGPAPVVRDQVPAPGASAVAVDQPVTVTFNEEVTNVTTATFTLTSAGGSPVDAAVTAGGGGTTDRTWVLTPGAPLSAGTEYVATVDAGVTDAAGNPLPADVVWHFTTG